MFCFVTGAASSTHSVAQTKKKKRFLSNTNSTLRERVLDKTSDISSSESSSSSSDSETEHEISLNRSDCNRHDITTSRDNQNDCSDSVIAHETSWFFGRGVLIDFFKDSKYNPRLHIQDPKSLSELDFWLLFFPSNDINHILACTNAHLREKRKQVSKHAFYKVIGLLYAMSLNVLGVRRDYWSQNDGLYPAPSFGDRFGMGLHRFEEILMSMAFAMPDQRENGDRWYQVRPLLEMTVSQWREVFSPGFKLTVDESMFAWYGKGNNDPDGMPAVIKIKRKPKGVGCEVKTICDSVSKIMIGMEINEGKDIMSGKKWQRDLGAGTATTLRLTEPWHGTGRIVVGDSWFGSVKTAVELRKRGLYFLGMVKTAHKNYPLQEAVKRCPQMKGSCVSATAKREDVPLTCIAWRDLRVHTFVGTCSTTMPGSPCRKKRRDENGGVYYKEVNRPKLVEEYFSGAPAIDIHNHIRQDGLALEAIWNTQKWQHRMYACIFGVVETNAFLAYNFFKRQRHELPLSHKEFTENLALQLIHNAYSGNNLQTNVAAYQPMLQQVNSQNDDGHTLQALSKDDEKNRQRVQRKCLVCSRVRKVQTKASYFCKKCGVHAVLCSPQTGRNCFEYHIKNGIPLRG